MHSLRPLVQQSSKKVLTGLEQVVTLQCWRAVTLALNAVDVQTTLGSAYKLLLKTPDMTWVW